MGSKGELHHRNQRCFCSSPGSVQACMQEDSAAPAASTSTWLASGVPGSAARRSQQATHLVPFPHRPGPSCSAKDRLGGLHIGAGLQSEQPLSTWEEGACSAEGGLSSSVEGRRALTCAGGAGALSSAPGSCSAVSAVKLHSCLCGDSNTECGKAGARSEAAAAAAAEEGGRSAAHQRGHPFQTTDHAVHCSYAPWWKHTAQLRQPSQPQRRPVVLAARWWSC